MQRRRGRASFIQAFELFFAQFDFQCTQAARKLFHRARADDGRGDNFIVQHPRQCDVGGPFAKFIAERFVLFPVGRFVFR